MSNCSYFCSRIVSTQRFLARVLCANLLFALVICIPLNVSPSLLEAQDLVSQTTLRHTPQDTVAVLSIWPKRLAECEKMQLAPLEVFTALGSEMFGVDPLKITRFDLLVGLNFGQDIGGIVQFVEAVDLTNIQEDWLSEKGLQNDGKTAYLAFGGANLVAHQTDAKTIMFGAETFIPNIMKENEPGRVASLLEQVQTNQEALLIFSNSSLRRQLVDLPKMLGLPGRLANGLTELIKATDFVAVGFSLAEEEKLQVVFSANSDQDADNLQAALNDLLEFARDTFLEELRVNGKAKVAEAREAYIARVSRTVLQAISPERSGKALAIEIKQLDNFSVTALLAGMAAPAFDNLGTAGRQQISSNNLKQLGLAFHNFESAYRTLPATTGLDDDGKPMLSWRVALLPFLEEAQLYQQFHLDEPWDSEHNITLLEKMPAVFRHPKLKLKPGYTVYQAPVSDKSLLRVDEPTGFRDVTDGTSNTILLVETAGEVAVPWTAPEDYKIDEENPKANLFTNGGTIATFADGSVRTIPETITNQILNALFTRAGGEIVDF